jgi:hypothetical protein
VDPITKSIVTVPYASLLNAKIVEQFDDDYLAVDKHFFRFCMQSIIENINVDEKWYLNKYPDVLLAIEEGAIPSASTHYTRHGYFENRLPYLIEVDSPWYLEQYPDVRRAIERGEIPSAQSHFETVGFAEGRLPYTNFTLKMVSENGDSGAAEQPYARRAAP